MVLSNMKSKSSLIKNAIFYPSFSFVAHSKHNIVFLKISYVHIDFKKGTLLRFFNAVRLKSFYISMLGIGSDVFHMLKKSGAMTKNLEIGKVYKSELQTQYSKTKKTHELALLKDRVLLETVTHLKYDACIVSIAINICLLRDSGPTAIWP